MIFDSDSDEDDFTPVNAPANRGDGGHADSTVGGGGENEGANVYAAYNAFYDEELEEPKSDVPSAHFAPIERISDDDHSADEPHNDGKKKKKKTVHSSPDRAGKRRRRVDAPDGGKKYDDDGDDDDFESQQSILKWVRTVPGPLQDVMKNQQAMEAENSGQFASGGSMGSGAMISTVFDDGPWVDMCDFLGIPTTRGRLYGGIRMSSLKHTLSYILEDDQSSPKIPKLAWNCSQLLLLVKSMKYVDEEIVAVFHDPTGEIEGYFHRDIVEQVGPALGAGTGVLLRKVSVFTPTDATSVGRRKSYLNIIPRNLQRVFLPKLQESSYGATVGAYNNERAVLVAAEDADDENHRAQEEEEQRLLQHDALRHASTELSFLSQRQVVHRNPPVRLDPNAAVATAGDGKGGKSKNSKKKDESSSGLGKWQWNQLVQRKSSNGSNNAARLANAAHAADRETSSSANSQLLPTSRFTALLSRQIATKRRSSDTGIPESSFVAIEEGDEEEDTTESAENDRTMPTRVRFASTPVVMEIPATRGAPSADVSKNEEISLNEDKLTPRPAVVLRHQSPAKKDKAPAISFAKRRDEEVEAVDEDEDDDDW